MSIIYPLTHLSADRVSLFPIYVANHAQKGAPVVAWSQSTIGAAVITLPWANRKFTGPVSESTRG